MPVDKESLLADLRLLFVDEMGKSADEWGEYRKDKKLDEKNGAWLRDLRGKFQAAVDAKAAKKAQEESQEEAAATA
jgi:hypothetical protein